jgi:hypothetical protein
MKFNLQSRIATTVTDLGSPSVIASSPTIEPGAKDRQYPLVTLRRSDADLEQALFKPLRPSAMLPASNSTSLSASNCGFTFANTLSENWIGRLGNMPEKLRFEGTPVVLLLIFGESFRTAMDGTIVQQESALF